MSAEITLNFVNNYGALALWLQLSVKENMSMEEKLERLTKYLQTTTPPLQVSYGKSNAQLIQDEIAERYRRFKERQELKKHREMRRKGEENRFLKRPYGLKTPSAPPYIQLLNKRRVALQKERELYYDKWVCNASGKMAALKFFEDSEKKMFFSDRELILLIARIDGIDLNAFRH